MNIPTNTASNLFSNMTNLIQTLLVFQRGSVRLNEEHPNSSFARTHAIRSVQSFLVLEFHVNHSAERLYRSRLRQQDCLVRAEFLPWNPPASHPKKVPDCN